MTKAKANYNNAIIEKYNPLLYPNSDLQYSCVETGQLPCVTTCTIENQEIALNLCFKYSGNHNSILNPGSQNNAIKLNATLLIALGILTYAGVTFMAKPISFACKKAMNLLKNPGKEDDVTHKLDYV